MSRTSNFSHADSDRIPSYEESVASMAPPVFEGKALSRPSIQQNLGQTRSRRISEAITEYIEPLLLSFGRDGIYKKAFVLLPSDILPQQSLSERNLVLSQTLPVTLIRLQGEDNQALFWQQPAVIDEFATALQALLTASESDQPSFTPEASTPIAPLPPNPPQKSWLKKKFGLPDADQDPTGSTSQWKLGWRSEQVGAGSERGLRTDEIDAGTRLKDVSFRTETELGLLTTETVKCVWFEIEVGA
jgi:hypothetical protein